MTDDAGKRVDTRRIELYFTEDTTETDPTLLGSRCPDCGLVEFPRLERCPSCLESMTPQPLSEAGQLHSYTTVRFGPPQFDPPYTIGCVDLPEEVRIFTRLEPTDAEYEIGQTVALRIAPVSETDEAIELGYAFGPAV